jgi:hypothetical protein
MSGEKPLAVWAAEDFLGQVSETDPQHLPEGAAVRQVNVQSDRPGRLAVRGGLRLVAYESEG